MVPLRDPGHVRQAELRHLADLQLAAWRAHDAATRYAQELAKRLDRGAEVEVGELRWDADSGMARTRKEKQA